MKTVLITGAAGFIGSSLAKYLINRNHFVIGIDNFADNYSELYKNQNIKDLLNKKNFIFYNTDILATNNINAIFKKHIPNVIIHFAALTGVRKSIAEPKKYFEVNTKGTEILYEFSLTYKSKNFIFASSSSVYGNSRKMPFSENQRLLPVSPYAKSKYEAEKLLKKKRSSKSIPTTVLRFFSVYGPHGRPDMAPYLFTEASFNRTLITQYGIGDAARDFTYIDDVIAAIDKVMQTENIFEVLNIGNSSPVTLLTLINTIELITGIPIDKKIVAPNEIESYITYADISRAKKLLGWTPHTSFEAGMKKFIEWYIKNRL